MNEGMNKTPLKMFRLPLKSSPTPTSRATSSSSVQLKATSTNNVWLLLKSWQCKGSRKKKLFS